MIKLWRLNLHKSQIFLIICLVFLLFAFFVSKSSYQREVSYFPRLQNYFLQKINRVLPYPQSAFLAGLLLGYRESLPKDLLQSFNRSGITHIIALSGWNITLIIVFLQRFFICFLRRQYTIIPILLFIVFFALLTGASPSLIRASLMGLLILLAQNIGRLVSPLNLLAFVAAAMVAFKVNIIHDIGWQLSFAATAGILYLASPLQRYLKSEILSTTVAALLFTYPLIFWHFGQFSLIALMANLLVLPFIPWAMGLGFLSVILQSEILGWFAWLVLTYIIKVAEILSSLPYASFTLD